MTKRVPDSVMSKDPSVRFIASAMGAGCAEIATLPIDVTKVRLQTATRPTSQFGVARSIIVHEGFSALWKGLAPALVRQCSYTGLSLVLYEPIRDAIAGKDVAKHEMPFWKRVLAGGTAGGTSIFVMNPTDVLKARMQNSRDRLSLGGTLHQIWRHSGLRGLWAGSTPNVARCFVGNAAELGCYDQFKTMLCHKYGLKHDATTTHFGASTLAGFVSSVVSTPVDVLKTRLQAAAGLRNDGLFALALNIPRHEGFFAFYKGFWPLFQRKVLWTVIFFVAYEKFRAGLTALRY
ncbi:hypothetical protein CTAYLR_008170 [Chrysophaeum taylorii]|uniref:Mitochondrial carrier protein n=1 Tax=Chrysophaeum taylorii TaxID=2483200 RepID=A0AAD7XIF6_9STRA|nr:hypothetical protein CTAYLR_008170 [Chrysophaeum taylorii]